MCIAKLAAEELVSCSHVVRQKSKGLKSQFVTIVLFTKITLHLKQMLICCFCGFTVKENPRSSMDDECRRIHSVKLFQISYKKHLCKSTCRRQD